MDVLVRVHKRMEDLAACLYVIRTQWKLHRYRVVVVSNGLAAGYSVPQSCRDMADVVIELNTNPGHVGGSKQLFMAGLEAIGNHSEYAVLLEADTWLFDDTIVDRYRQKMAETGAVWASAPHHNKYHSLCLDFALINTKYVRGHAEISDFGQQAECSVCNALRSQNVPYLLIKEVMPVHLPKFLILMLGRSDRRRYAFVRAMMVTHHIEKLRRGMTEKREVANMVAGKPIFDVPMPKHWKRTRNLMGCAESALHLYAIIASLKKKTRPKAPIVW